VKKEKTPHGVCFTPQVTKPLGFIPARQPFFNASLGEGAFLVSRRLFSVASL